MYAQVNKENSAPANRQESRAIANAVGQKKSEGKQGVGFVDNRPEAMPQREFKDNRTLKESSINGKKDVVQRFFDLL